MNTHFSSQDAIRIAPIGVIRTPFKQKFTVPRQPRLIKLAKGEIYLSAPFNQLEAVQELEQFTHIYLLFWFHLNPVNKSITSNDYQWKPTVKPPRLGGKQKMGVFATRSPFRPNPIGLSVVKLDGIEQRGREVIIKVSGVDLVDQTPIIDIKPYIPFSDSIPDADAGFASEPPKSPFVVTFSAQASIELKQHCDQFGHSITELEEFIKQVLAQDPRPAYHLNKDSVREYGVELSDMNIKWQLSENRVTILRIETMIA